MRYVLMLLSALVILTSCKPVPVHDWNAPPVASHTAGPLEEAACVARDGAWACPSLRKPVVLATTSTTPIIPPSWTVPNWWIDPANSTTCASDSNSCTSATCDAAGIGPCLTWHEINDHRWGCIGNPNLCPRLQQNTTITFMSSQTTDSDPVALYPQVEGGHWIGVTGSLGAAQTVCSGTLGGYVAHNTGTNALTQATLPCTGAVNELVFDTTANAAFWTYKANTPPAYFVSEPINSTVNYVLGALPTPAETALTNGDAITVYNPVTVFLTAMAPTIISGGSGNTNQSSLTNITIGRGTTFRDSTLYGGVGQSVFLVNVTAQRGIMNMRATNRVPSWNNVDLQSGMTIFPGNQGGLSTGIAQLVKIAGGIVGIQNSTLNGAGIMNGYNNVCFSGDVILGSGGVASNFFYSTDPTWGQAYIDSGSTVAVDGSSAVVAACGVSGQGSRVWGTGTLNAIGGHQVYPSGAGGAAAFYLSGLTLQINSQTKACIAQPGATAIGACNTTVTAANLDANAGATSGCLTVLGGGAFCNFGP